MIKPKLSICIPTYNRAEFAYKAAEHLLEGWTGDEIEVLISDNNSSDDTKGLISTITDHRLKYFRNDSNLGAAFNTHLAFMRATGEFAYLTSDEDDLILSEIPYLLEYFDKHPNTSVFVGGGDLTYTKKRFPDETYTSPFEALKAIGFNTRYMTGIILNQKKYAEQMDWISFEKSAEIWDAYSFMYAIARLCCCGDVVTSSHLLFTQPRLTMTDISNNARNDGIYYYEPMGRVHQMQTWSKAIADLPIIEHEKEYLIVKVIFDSIELATRFYNSDYVNEVQKTVPASDFVIYKKRIESLDRKKLVTTILDKGIMLFEQLFGHSILVQPYYIERLREINVE